LVVFLLQLVEAIGQDGTFWLYAGFGVVAFVYLFFQVPETKGYTL
jgi:hypothetical protein